MQLPSVRRHFAEKRRSKKVASKSFDSKVREIALCKLALKMGLTSNHTKLHDQEELLTKHLCKQVMSPSIKYK